MAKRLGLCVLMSALLLGWSGLALAQDARIYELTENMKLVGGKLLHRKATSELMGTANVNTPLCPAALVAAVNPGATTCTINATGSDNINVATGLGNFGGTFTVVVQGDNPFDGPEAVVAKGAFRGAMDFSPAVLAGIPYGTVKGTLHLDKSDGKANFTGVFRLPFAGNIPIPELRGATLRQALCPLTPAANPYTDLVYGGYDLAYLGTTDGVLNGSCIDIQPNELSLGTPTVRFDIKF